MARVLSVRRRDQEAEAFWLRDMVLLRIDVATERAANIEGSEMRMLLLSLLPVLYDVSSR